MKSFNINNYINSSIKNNIGSLQEYLSEAKRRKGADKHFDILASLYARAADAVRGQDAIENAEKIYRARYLKARAAYYGQGAKKTAAQAEQIKSGEPKKSKKEEAQQAVEVISKNVANAQTPAPEPDLFTGIPSSIGYTSQVSEPTPKPESKKPIKGRTRRTSEVAKGVVKKASGKASGVDDEGLRPEHRAELARIRAEKARKNSDKPKPANEDKPSKVVDDEKSADRFARRKEAKKIADSADKKKKSSSDSAA